MRKVGYAIAVLVLLLVVIGFAAPYLVPVGTLKTRIAAVASDSLGRTVAINGPVRLAVFPHLRLEAQDVTVANAPSAGAGPMAKLGTLALDLDLLPLLSGTVALDRLELIDPVISLQVDAQGRPNWALGTPAVAPPAPGTPAPARPATPTAPPAAPPAAEGPKQVHLGTIRLTNGKLTYADQRTGKSETVEQIDLDLSLPDLDHPLAAQGSLVWNKQKIDLALGIAKPRAFLAGNESGLSARLSGAPLKAGFKGDAALRPQFALKGDVDLEVPSVRGLAAWLGKPMTGSGSTFGPLSVSGALTLAGDKARFTQAKLSLDAIKATGDLAVDSGGARPALSGQLALDRLDLNPYLAGTTAGPGAPATPAAAPAGAATAPTGAPPRPAGGWSDARIDLSGLGSADVDLTLSTGGLSAGHISIGKSVLAVTLKDGKLAADLKQMALYQGSGTARIALDSAGALAFDCTLGHIAIQPFLKDTVDIDRVSGTGDISLSLTSRGLSERALIEALGGKGSFGLADGAVQGIDLGAMFKNVGQAFLDAAGGKAQQTPFGQLSGTLTVAGGVIRNDDLALKSQVLDVSGSGTVDLPRRVVDYRLTPHLIGTAAPKGVAGLTVPVLIQGPLDAPQYKPDLAGALQQGLGGALKGKKPADLLKGLFGGK